MLRINQSTSAAGAKSYYSTADYYTEGQELVGQWRGEGAQRLGLSGIVNRKEWDALCDNRNPATGSVLTPRQKQNRRVGYDFNFHVPKSISILYGLTRDDRILDAFRDSVNATMADMESEMETRVRGAGRDDDRTTGNMVWGEFVHTTARPVDGLPDPHLHAHCFVFNTTWDQTEQRWKAGQFADLKRDAPYFEAVFYSRFARRLEELGLPIERTRKGWELRDLPGSAIEKFSRRTALIEEKARQHGITDPEEKGELGAKTRERKQKEIGFDALREYWKGRLTPDEEEAVRTVADRLGRDAIPEDERAAAEGAARAVEHCLERSSVVPERRLLAEALKRSVGAASPETVQRKVAEQGLVVAERDGRLMATTTGVLGEERAMIAFARNGRGTCRRLGAADHKFKRAWLDDGQRKAVLHVLNSPDRVMLVRGGAGTGNANEGTRSLQTVRDIVSDPEKLDMAIKVMGESDAWGGLLNRMGGQLRHFVEKERASVLTTVGRHLKFLDTPAVRENTNCSTFDPAILLKGGVTVYLILTPDHMRSQSQLLRMWIGSLMRGVIRGGLNRERRIHFVLDEAASLGHLDCIDDAVDKFRGYGVRLQFYYQSLGQLKKCFPGGQDQTLLSNVTSVFFGVNDNATADYVSVHLGDETVVVDSGSKSKGTSYQTTQAMHPSTSRSYSDNVTESWQQQARRLLKPEEVMALSPREAITFAPGVRPIRTTLLRHYEEPRLGRRRGLLARVGTATLILGLSTALSATLCWFAGDLSTATQQRHLAPSYRIDHIETTKTTGVHTKPFKKGTR